jgi:nucleolar protein 6
MSEEQKKSNKKRGRARKESEDDVEKQVEEVKSEKKQKMEKPKAAAATEETEAVGGEEAAKSKKKKTRGKRAKKEGEGTIEGTKAAMKPKVLQTAPKKKWADMNEEERAANALREQAEKLEREQAKAENKALWAQRHKAGGAKTEENKEGEEKEKTPRFIVFMGNLPFRTTVEQITQFLASKNLVPLGVRMPTDKETNKPKGFAFVEFSDGPTQRRALHLHLESFAGRKINMELTAGGGGNTPGRKQKLQDRRDRMDVQRKTKKDGEAAAPATIF